MNNLDALAKLVQALSPWRAHLVFVGGSRIESTGSLQRPASWHTNRYSLATLIWRSPTKPLFRKHNPAVTHYSLGDEHGGFYAEFLTPLIVSGAYRACRNRISMKKR